MDKIDTKTKKEIIYSIGEELHLQRKVRKSKISTPYDTTFINEGSDLYEEIHKFFIRPYEHAIENNWYPDSDLKNELQSVINLIKRVLSQYEEKSENAEFLAQYERTLSIERMLKERTNGQLLPERT